MPRGNGFTRRGIFGVGAAGAVAAGLSACGDDYFEPATSHGKDVPNVVLIFTDSTRADFIGHYNKHFGYGNRLADTPNLDALGRDSLAFEMAVPEAMPTGPARRGLLTGVRSFPFRNYVPTPGPAGRARLDLDPGQPADRHRGAGRGRRRDGLLHGQPVPRSGRGSPTSAAPSTSSSRASPRARTASSTSRSSARRRAAPSSATCCPS